MLYFLDINLLEMYSKFLPEPVNRLLKRLFHSTDHKKAHFDGYTPESLSKKRAEGLDDDTNENEKRIYLTGWEVTFDGEQHCQDFMATHVTDKPTARNASSGIELIFVEDKLVKAYNWEEGDRHDRPMDKKEIGMPYQEYLLNRHYQMVEDPLGLHALGGDIPPGFQIPDNNCVVPFQYLGHISEKDPVFSWLPFTLHLVCPVYLNFDKLYLEYGDPLKPSIVNREEVESADTSFDGEIDGNSEVVYKLSSFSFVETIPVSDPGQAGMPNWIQYPDIPHCPKTGKLMKFVCQLHGGVPVKRTNVHPDNEFYRTYFESMNFWGDGDLFVFFQPESKVACYMIQNT